MRQIILNIEDTKFSFFLELIKSLNFVRIEENKGDSKKEIINNLKQGFKELKLYRQGKLKTTSANDFLNEI